jgi:hypothetical protein
LNEKKCRDRCQGDEDANACEGCGTRKYKIAEPYFGFALTHCGHHHSQVECAGEYRLARTWVTQPGPTD